LSRRPGCIQLPSLNITRNEERTGYHKGWVRLDCEVSGSNRFLVPPAEKVGKAHAQVGVVVHRIVGAEMNRPQTMLNRLVKVPRHSLGHGTETQRKGGIAVQREGTVHCSGHSHIVVGENGDDESCDGERQCIVGC